jgi:hypothetical protein
MRIRRLEVSAAELAIATMHAFRARSVSIAEAETFLADSSHYLMVADGRRSCVLQEHRRSNRERRRSHVRV